MKQLIKILSDPKNLIFVCVIYTTTITLFFLVPISVGIETTLPLDKLVHIGFNAALIYLWLHYFSSKYALKGWLPLTGILITCIVYGIIIEIMQESFTTTRQADVWDVVANITGSVMGLISFKFLKTKF